MTKIKVLAPNEVMKIAAGEVVRRPASVVKELIENALDAEAKTITVRLNDAGFSQICIIDDGIGMSIEDAKLAILPHATSKITSLDDLAKLTTFGFRGEALASIAAVSDLEITTAQANDDVAHKLIFCLGVLAKEQDTVAKSVGTTITVRQLFYNLPVRRKFLKSKETESNQVRQAFIDLALMHTQVTFKLFEDDKLIINAMATSKLCERVAQLFDHQFAKNLLPVSYHAEDIELTGLCSNLSLMRYNKNYIYLFVNSRPFRDAKLSNAICQGYAGALPDGKFPAVILNLTVPAEQVDVNIHPAKEEVAFLHYGKVLNACKQSIHQALEKIVALPEISLATQLATQTTEPPVSLQEISFVTPIASTFAENKEIELNPAFNLASPAIDKKSSFFGLTEFEPLPTYPPKSSTINTAFVPTPSSTQAPLMQTTLQSNNFVIFGQVFNTYILYQHQDKFGLVDQHAASERILYEEMKSNFTNLPSVGMIFPALCDLEQKQLIDKVLALRELLCDFGIIFDQCSKTSIRVTGLPPDFAAQDLKSFFANITQDLEFGHDPQLIRQQAFEKLHAQLACKRAIKAGDILSPAKMEALLNNLQKTSNKYQCIHGRPTIHEFSKDEVAKWFRRQ